MKKILESRVLEIDREENPRIMDTNEGVEMWSSNASSKPANNSIVGVVLPGMKIGRNFKTESIYGKDDRVSTLVMVRRVNPSFPPPTCPPPTASPVTIMSTSLSLPPAPTSSGVSIFGISVHPSLFLDCAALTEKEESVLNKERLAYLRLKPYGGVKAKFLVEFVRLCDTFKEKVLVFSQFIDPLELIIEQLKYVFSWSEGKEVMYVSGDVT